MYQTVPRAAAGNAYILSRGRLAGLGAGATGPSSTQVAQQVGSIATAGTVATLAALGSTSLIPFVGPAIAGIVLAVTTILNSGCGDACIVTSNWANQAADLLEQNIRAYFALPVPRPVEAKAQALANFDNIWSYLHQQCSNPSLSTAGQHCISDRQSGACVWHQTGQPEFPGQPAYGDCWNWFSAFRDPIANDPAVVTENTISLAGGGTTTTGTAGAASPGGLSLAGLDLTNLALVAGMGLLAFGLMGSN